MDGFRKVTNDCNCGHRRVIIHVDMDCYYAQVEMLKNPVLSTKPLGIQQKNCVVTCNYIAREKGVKKLMSLKNAQQLCPDLVLVCGEDLTEYRDLSYKVSKHLQGISSLVERLGLDENFVDVTEEVIKRLQDNKDNQHRSVGKLFSSKSNIDYYVDECLGNCHQHLAVGSCIAQEIRDSLLKEFGLTCCAGIAHNKLLAKLVSGTHKPNQQTLIFPEQSFSLLNSLSSIKKIPGIGSSTATKLAAISIESISQMQTCSLTKLEIHFGRETSSLLKNYCLGIDESQVVPFGKPQSHGLEDSFQKCSSLQECQRKIKEMALKLMERVSQDGRIPQTIRLTIRRASGSRETRQSPLSKDLWKDGFKEWLPKSEERIVVILMSLFTKLVGSNDFTLTLIGVTFCKFQEPEKCSINKYLCHSRSAEPEDIVESDNKRTRLEKHILPENVDSSVFQELPEEVKQNLAEWRERLPLICAKSSPSAIEDIPHNVDPEVFVQLPDDIKKELRMKWEESKVKKKSPKSLTIMNYFKKV